MIDYDETLLWLQEGAQNPTQAHKTKTKKKK